jgi:hypothetical protein
MEKINNYDKLRNLLLNDYDNNMFLTNQTLGIYNYLSESTTYYYIWGIRDMNSYDYLENKDGLFLGVKKIYIIKRDNNNSYYYEDKITKYIKNSEIEIETLICDLTEFAEEYPEFKHFRYNNYFEYLDWGHSRKPEIGTIYDKTYQCKDLAGSFILPNLIVGESFDFDEYSFNSLYIEDTKKRYMGKIDILVNNGITCIINVGADCVRNYFPAIIEILKSKNIEVFIFPIVECSEKSEYKMTTLHQVADLLNKKLNDNNNKVYLHCYMGKNRSASAAIMYMVKYLGMSLKDAYLNICLKRPIHPQKELIHIIYDEVLKKEENPIALHKLIIDKRSMPSDKFSFTSGSFALGGYDIYMLDVIAGRKQNPLMHE